MIFWLLINVKKNALKGKEKKTVWQTSKIFSRIWIHFSSKERITADLPIYKDYNNIIKVIFQIKTVNKWKGY